MKTLKEELEKIIRAAGYIAYLSEGDKVDSTSFTIPLSRYGCDNEGHLFEPLTDYYLSSGIHYILIKGKIIGGRMIIKQKMEKRLIQFTGGQINNEITRLL